jgi:hypothetical protein
MSIAVRLRSVAGVYGVARLDPASPIPGWFDGPGFSALMRAEDELTLVCLQERIPETIETERNWRCFRSLGPIPFNATGIVQALIEPLSTQDIGVFVVCTFDGEHILVADADWERSRRLLEQAGHVFEA